MSTNAPQGTNPPQGTKRRADTSLDGEQRLSKRFDLLNLDNTNAAARLYIPVPGSRDRAAAAAAAPTSTPPHPLAPNASTPKRRRPPPLPSSPDSMQIEDTPHRVYIHDLSAELSDTDSDSENPIFLSDIEKHLSKIPRHVLLGPPPAPTAHNQVVLYNVPASLSVPAEEDGVRKAIVEARQRIRERLGGVGGVGGESGGESGGECSAVEHPRPVEGTPMQDQGEDADAMDLD